MTSTTKVRVLDGIWIYAKTTTTVPLAFETNPQVVPPTKDLAIGWNAIGHAGVKPVTARDALSSVAAKWSMSRGSTRLFSGTRTRSSTAARATTGLPRDAGREGLLAVHARAGPARRAGGVMMNQGLMMKPTVIMTIGTALAVLCLCVGAVSAVPPLPSE